MTTYHLTSITAFDEPLTYHQTAATFLEYHAGEMLRRAQPLIDELYRCHPQGAAAFANTSRAMGQRLHDESTGHRSAVTYLISHRLALATIEAQLAGLPPPTFAPPHTPDAGQFIDPVRTLIKGTVHELRSRMGQVQHTLYEFDGGLRDLEFGLQHAIPPELHLVPGIDGILDAAYQVVHHGRRAFDTLFVPAIDGEVAQPFIDYLRGLQSAYRTHVMQPFDSVTGTFVANYTPPPHLAQYHDSLAAAPAEQQRTYPDLGKMAEGLQSVVNLSEELTGLQLLALGLVLATAALLTTTIIGALMPLPATAVPMTDSIGGTVGTTAAIGTTSTALGTTIEGELSWEIPTWLWCVIGGSLTLPNILEHNTTADKKALLRKVLGTNTVYAKKLKTTDGKEFRGRKLSDDEVHDLGLHGIKQALPGTKATDDIYAEVDNNGDYTGEIYITRHGDLNNAQELDWIDPEILVMVI